MQHLAYTLLVHRCSNKTEHTEFQCYMQCTTLPYFAAVTKRNTLLFSAWCQSELLTDFVLNCPEMLSSKRRLRDDIERVMKH